MVRNSLFHRPVFLKGIFAAYLGIGAQVEAEGQRGNSGKSLDFPPYRHGVF